MTAGHASHGSHYSLALAVTITYRLQPLYDWLRMAPVDDLQHDLATAQGSAVLWATDDVRGANVVWVVVKVQVQVVRGGVWDEGVVIFKVRLHVVEFFVDLREDHQISMTHCLFPTGTTGNAFYFSTLFRRYLEDVQHV